MKFTPEQVEAWPHGHKECVKCREVKPFAEFHKHSKCLFGYNTVCKACRVPLSKQNWMATDYRRRMYDRAKARAGRNGREFTISLDDIVIPELCPILGVPLVHDPGSPYVPSLDRRDSSKGYIPGNVVVMSRRANTLKNNMTTAECEALLNYLKDGNM